MPDKKIIGRITMQFVQHEADGMWNCEVKSPRTYSKSKRDTVKMALITAVLQDHVNKTLHTIDRMVMNNAEIAEYESMKAEEKKNQYQTTLPFEDREE
jgi:hypothetical protein